MNSANQKDNMKCVMKHVDVEKVRHERGKSMLLFITDRCPVGCAHCSVDSRFDSPMITDFNLFKEIVNWMCLNTTIQVVGISGGEPFIEKKGLIYASESIKDAGKEQVIFTSGIWAKSAQVPAWIRQVLARCSCVYLSTDAFHAASVEDDYFIRAAKTIAAEGTWMVIQVLNDKDMIERVRRLLQTAFGENFEEFAEINTVNPLTNGRGANVFIRNTELTGESFGPCSLAMSPMVRYDGLVTGCCNESVIMSFGPSRLRKRVKNSEGLENAVKEFHADPLMKAISGAGLGILTGHPRFEDLSEKKFKSNCDLCWKILDRMPNQEEPDLLINIISNLKNKENYEC